MCLQNIVYVYLFIQYTYIILTLSRRVCNNVPEPVVLCFLFKPYNMEFKDIAIVNKIGATELMFKFPFVFS